MAKYRKKVVEFEAVQWQPELKREELPKWFRDALAERLLVRDNDKLILSAGAEFWVRPGDWVTLDEDGLSAISDSTFKKLYDPA